MDNSFCISQTSTQFSELNRSFNSNNQKNIKNFRIFPTYEEFSHPLVRLQPVPKNYNFNDLAQYTTIMQSLLRENFLIPIRKSIKKQLLNSQNSNQISNEKVIDDRSIEIFDEYLVSNFEFDFDKGFIIYLIIKRKIPVDSNNQIKNNQLIVFLDKQSGKIFTSKVDNVENKQDKNNNQQKNFCNPYGDEEEDDDDFESQERGLNSASCIKEEKISVLLDLNQNLKEFLLNINQIESKYLLLQPTQYWYPFELALKSIQYFQKNMDSIAFPSTTLKNQGIPESPQYNFLNESNKKEYFESIEKVILAKEQILDQSQYETLKHALKTSNTIIQGPPGTGKTYLGCQIVNALMKTYQSKAHKPILIISKKNKSLDSILLKLEKYTKSILRIGSRISQEEIKKYSVQQQKGPSRMLVSSEKKWGYIKSKLNKLIQNLGKNDVPKKLLKNLAYNIDQELKNYSKDLQDRQNKSEQNYAFSMSGFMSQFAIIGMTVSGYQMNYEALDKLQSEIVLVEEASEILETDFVSILSPWLKHLIQIGDHQQLRPLVRCQEIQNDYNLRLSYFERLIKGQYVVCQLQNQRRMRIQFANFTRLFYSENYIDDKSVKRYNQINYINHKTSMQMIQHSFPEQNGACSSKINYFEALYAIKLAFYILYKEKFEEKEITILCMYKAQQQLIWRLIKSKKPFCQIQVCTVDQYQGEENEIVILSCVRSNNQNEIGFLGFENRINVAYSRAKQGFICLGNFLMYEKKSEMWKKINKLAKQQHSFYDQTTFDFKWMQNLFENLCREYSEIQQIKCENCNKNFHLGIC